MKNNKGISMISLVIIIVVTVILIGIATTAGYRYITESNKIQAQAVVTVISDAAYRRQNDLSAGVSVRYYEGYSFDVQRNAATKYAAIKGLPEEDDDSNSIPDCLEEQGAKWYLFDAESAKALGIVEADRFIENNISYADALKNEEVRLVLADYSTGSGYLVEMPKDIINDSLRQDGGCLNSPNGFHNFKIIATCTKPALCIYCGGEDPLNPALGHDFAAPTCTASGFCRRCGVVDPDNGPLGHLLIKNSDISNSQLIAAMDAKDCRMYANTDGTTNPDDPAWITDALKHWHECLRCGNKTETEEHSKGFVVVNNVYHYEMCSKCGWESIKTKHIFEYESLSDNTHLKKCKICLYEETHTDSGWIDTHVDYHYRICDDTNKCHDSTVIINGVTTEVLFKEAHYDNNDDLVCDVCGRYLDYTPPNPFGSAAEYYGKMIESTTNSITVEAYTEDSESGIDYYQFGILNPETGDIEWLDKIYPEDPSNPAQQVINGLKPNTEYTIYVKAADKGGNFTAPYKIPNTKTVGFPDFNGLTNIPDTYVQGPIEAGIAPINTKLTNLTIKYSLDEGENWSEIPIADILTETITLTKEVEKVWIKFVDDSEIPNESDVWEYVIEKIDLTPPDVAIEAKAEDNNEDLSTYHTAKVIISDEKAGIAPNTEVRYAWSTSNTEVPTEFITTHTQNLQNASTVSFEVITPADVKGNYYLWVLEGVKDRVGNPTTEPVCSEIYFSIDDVAVVVENIKMLNLVPEVENENLFVKTNGTVTISFDIDKKVSQTPRVTLNGQQVIISEVDDLSYKGTIEITESFKEGTLELIISNIVSETGKVSSKVYTNADLTEGPVIYDKTLPEFEYISKRS